MLKHGIDVDISYAMLLFCLLCLMKYKLICFVCASGR